MLRKIVCFLLCCMMLLSLPLLAFADVSDPASERSPYVYYHTDKAVCVFSSRTVEEITPVMVKVGRFDEYGVYPTLVDEGYTPVTYVVLMDATHYMRDRRKQMKELVEGLFQNNFAKTRVILLPYDMNNGLLWHYYVDSDAFPDRWEALAVIQQTIDSIDYQFQGNDVPANTRVLETLY